MLSYTEENYLKALLKLAFDRGGQDETGTNELAAQLGVKPATATDMLRKLRDKQLISYEKYGKISLSDQGRAEALMVLRKHRLWETFLYQKLEFTWDEVHEVAEQLEHIQSAKLVDKLDKFLQYPAFDPHGDPIPNARGELPLSDSIALSELPLATDCWVAAVRDSSSLFLQYLQQLSIGIGTPLRLVDKIAFDGSLRLGIAGQEMVTVSEKFAENVLVTLRNPSP